MPETLPEELKPYPNISSKAYEHPADRAATAALKAVPMLDTVVRKLIEWQYERAIRQMFLSNSVRVGSDSSPTCGRTMSRSAGSSTCRKPTTCTSPTRSCPTH